MNRSNNLDTFTLNYSVKIKTIFTYKIQSESDLLALEYLQTYSVIHVQKKKWSTFRKLYLVISLWTVLLYICTLYEPIVRFDMSFSAKRKKISPENLTITIIHRSHCIKSLIIHSSPSFSFLFPDSLAVACNV